MKRLIFGLLTAIALVGAGAGQSSAAPITTLFNTGVDANRSVLPDGTVGDPHYTLVSVPSGTTDIRVRTSAGGFPIPYYIGDNNLSAWIGPNNDQYLNGVQGNYVFRTTFDLTGLDPATALINGRWSADNKGIDILINGQSTGQQTAYFLGSYEYWYDFTLNSGFVSGVNTIDFVIYNDALPTALRVEMSGQTGSAVPEPASMITLAAGALGMLGFRMRKRKTDAVVAA